MPSEEGKLPIGACTCGTLERWAALPGSPIRRTLDYYSVELPAGSTRGEPTSVTFTYCPACGGFVGMIGVEFSASLRAETRCSFCHKAQSQVRALVAGRTACICDDCIALVHATLTDRRA